MGTHSGNYSICGTPETSRMPHLTRNFSPNGLRQHIIGMNKHVMQTITQRRRMYLPQGK